MKKVILALAILVFATPAFAGRGGKKPVDEPNCVTFMGVTFCITFPPDPLVSGP